MAADFVSYLRDLQWEIYQEVQIYSGSPRADIVAKQGTTLWVVECKRRLTLDLLGQAFHWRGYAHYVSVATESSRPKPGTMRRRRSYQTDDFVRSVLCDQGVGWLTADSRDARIQEIQKPKLRRRIMGRLGEALRPEHQTFAAAGNNRADYWSPFQQTCQELARYVAEHPGCPLKDAVAMVDHHYASPASAVSSLRHWLSEGKVRGVRVEREGRLLALYPLEAA
jgi:hypothetical protein